jgi:hypothetical protein
MRLPWWFWLAYADVKFWFATIPAAIVLALAAWYAPPWFGGLRWTLIAAVAVLAAPFPAAAAIFIFQKFDATRFWRTLPQAETLAGLPLPAGSKVRFADKAHSILVSIELPRVTEVRGMRLVGTLTPWGTWRGVNSVWGGMLAEDQCLDGLPCRAGPFAFDKFGGVLFDEEGVIHRCTLACEHEMFGLKLPRGTAVWRGSHGKAWDLLLPADAGVDIPALATTAPPGVTLSLANDGRLERIGSGHGQTILVCGIPLNSRSFELHGEVVISELAQAFSVAGEVRPAGTAVRIHPATGDVAVSGR